ncbi:MAG: Stp1/IreP family PP2C-type Ser/Thr phosphatase [Gudongella sp.]|jgi:protein phosphatase|nr:Stp1/IreP family PP2C-type Ser/Thr phosphatase [Gudongella sp.]
MLIGASTDIGLVRENNQDSMFISKDESLELFIVADGMGGHKAGEIASSMTVERIVKYIRDRAPRFVTIDDAQTAIVDAVNVANIDVFEHSVTSPECDGMGTTVTLAYAFKNKMIIGHVGDSRAYIVRDGGIAQLTEDHSLVNQLIRGGKITKQEAVNHPQKNVITRAVGTNGEINVDTIVLNIKKNDVIILCSDGLTNMIDDIELLSIFADRKDVQAACEIAVEHAKNNGGTDNITVVAIRI